MYNFSQNNNYWSTVNGYEGAKTFNVAPNQTILLIDTQEPYMYMKSASQMGQTTIKTFRIEEMPDNPEKVAENKRYAAFDERLKKIEELLTSKAGGEKNNA